MALDSGELERLADDILNDRVISTDLFCAECGYNLRTLRYLGRCPECGSEYNARHLWMKGIFTAGMLRFPAAEYAGGLATLAISAALIASGLRPPSQWMLAFGLAFLGMGGLYARAAWRGTARYLHFWTVARRIEADDD